MWSADEHFRLPPPAVGAPGTAVLPSKRTLLRSGQSRLKIADSKGVRPSVITGYLQLLQQSSSARSHPYNQSYVGVLADYLSGVEATDGFTRATENLRSSVLDIRVLEEQAN